MEEAPQKAPEPARHRVASHAVARTPRAFDRSWGLIGAGTVVLVLLFSALLWWMFRDRTPRPEPRPAPVAAADTTASPDTTRRPAGPATPRPTAGPRLAIPIRVTVTARGNGLQNFRVTAEPAERLGHWIEPGDSRTFESEQAVVLWGESAEGLSDEAEIALQGVRWTAPAGQVLRIDRATGQRLLDSLATAPPAGTTPAATDGDGE